MHIIFHNKNKGGRGEKEKREGRKNWEEEKREIKPYTHRGKLLGEVAILAK